MLLDFALDSEWLLGRGLKPIVYQLLNERIRSQGQLDICSNAPSWMLKLCGFVTMRAQIMTARHSLFGVADSFMFFEEGARYRG